MRFFVDLGQRLQQVDRAGVVPDAFHRGAGVAVRIRVEDVVAEVGVVGGEGHVAALGQLLGVVQVGLAAEARRFALADLRRLVQAEHAARFARAALRHQQVGGDAVVLLGDVGDLRPREGGEIFLLDLLDVEPRLLVLGILAHHELQVVEHGLAAASPLGARGNVDDQVFGLAVGGVGGPQAVRPVRPPAVASRNSRRLLVETMVRVGFVIRGFVVTRGFVISGLVIAPSGQPICRSAPLAVSRVINERKAVSMTSIARKPSFWLTANGSPLRHCLTK